MVHFYLKGILLGNKIALKRFINYFNEKNNDIIPYIKEAYPIILNINFENDLNPKLKKKVVDFLKNN